MRKAFIYSILFHLGFAVLALVVIPAVEPLPVEDIDTIEVEIADLTVTTRSQKPSREEEPEPKEEQPPKPPPAPKPRPEPEPKPEPLPEPEEAEAPPEPEPAPPETPEEQQVAIVTPTAKPRPKIAKKKDDFDSMLNTLELDDEPADAAPEKPREEDFFDSLDLDSIETDDKPQPREKTQIASIIGTKLTVSELDAVKRQFEKCWNVPIGARNPEELVVEVKIWVNRDRTVRKAEIIDTARMASDRFFRSMAEAARRAVLHKNCNPLDLPPEKYDLWKEITMTFDPGIMVGR